MKEFFTAARHLAWLTQFGLSVALPPVLCLLGAGWLRENFGLGGWVTLAGLAAGVAGAVSCLTGNLRALERQGRADDPSGKGNEPPPVSFNQHL